MVYHLHFKVSIACSDKDLIMALSTIFLVVLVLLATSSFSVMCEGAERNIDQHWRSVRVNHRVRRMTGYRQKCVPVKKNLCAILSHNRITKPFRFVQIRDIGMADGLDLLNIVHHRVQGQLALKDVKPLFRPDRKQKLTPKNGVIRRKLLDFLGPKIWNKFPRNSVGANILNDFRNKLDQMWGN